MPLVSAKQHKSLWRLTYITEGYEDFLWCNYMKSKWSDCLSIYHFSESLWWALGGCDRWERTGVPRSVLNCCCGLRQLLDGSSAKYSAQKHRQCLPMNFTLLLPPVFDEVWVLVCLVTKMWQTRDIRKHHQCDVFIEQKKNNQS